MTRHLQDAMNDAGYEATTAVMETLRRAADVAHGREDPKALLYGGLHGSMLRKEDDHDAYLVAGVVQVAGIRPAAIEEVIEELLKTDKEPLCRALAQELAGALHHATNDLRQAQRELAQGVPGDWA